MKDDKKNIIILLMGVAIVILLVLCVVLLINTIKLNDNISEPIKNSEKQEVENDNTSNEENRNKIYDEVIKQYSSIINGDFDDNYDYTGEYKYIVHEYPFVSYIKKSKWIYTYYDINKDGISEMLIASNDINQYNDNAFIHVIYTNNGKEIMKVDNYWSRNRFYGIYDNGYIVNNGSGGALVSGYDFITINNDQSINRKICIVNYGTESIIESIECDNKKTDYNSVDELIISNIKNGKKIDLNTLTWNEID